MTALQIIFLIVALLTLASAVMVVSARRMMHAALWLVLTLLGVAVLFATLESGFFTAVQVVVYIGAIAILIIFAVMLTRRDLQDEEAESDRRLGINALSRRLGVNRFAPLAALGSLAVFAAIVVILNQWPAFAAVRPNFPGEDIAALGQALVSPDMFAIPFEVASVLLIGALIGAVYVAGGARKEKGGRL